tara:strand:+ start:160 stop:1014 length:855 start_codon:yes stop_codon:yes gene_type:complete
VERATYEEVITRRRWKLTEGVWLVHGFLMQTKKEFGTHMELFYNKEQKKIIDRDMEAGRLSDGEIDRLLSLDTNEVSTVTRVIDIFKKERVWEILDEGWFNKPYDEDGNVTEPDHEARWVEESIRNLWHMINTRADIKQAEIPYVDENGTWYALSPLAEWNAEYLVNFARDAVGIDVDWLIEDIEKHKKKHPTPVSLTDTKIEVEEPEREKNYTPMVLKTGKELLADGIEVNAGTVIDRWKDNPPDGIKDVTDDHFYYRHVDGHWNKVETKNLKRTIGRYFKKA